MKKVVLFIACINVILALINLGVFLVTGTSINLYAALFAGAVGVVGILLFGVME